jgi:glycerophosphoryl diester phosphodiesterase
LDPDLMARIRHAGKSVGVWTVNDPAAIDKFVGLGVDYLITDDPVGAAARNR